MATDIIARGMASEAERAANKYVAGTNINFIPQEDGTVKITASGDVSSEDGVARELINNHKIDMNNPHNVTAEQLGLGNVDNTSDISKPISKATQNALDGKSNTNHTHTTYDSHIENVEIHVTAEEKATWSAINYSNPNLLINPDFAVNQRGEAEYSGNGEYGVDCWKIYGDAKISVVSGGVIFSRQAGAASGAVFQPNERLLGLIGETVTLSVVVDGQRYTKSMVVPASGQSEILTAPNGNWFLYKQAGFVQISCSCTKNTNVISRVKVERGGIATEFVSPDIATELAKCQRYYQIRSTGNIAAVDMRPNMATIKDIKQRSDGNYEYIAEL